MTTLLLRLAGPLQSWGSSSRFARRTTENAPTKSGVLGLLAAAQGRRRTDPLTDLLGLRFGVRVDQSGVLQRDFHTAHHQVTGVALPLSERYYRADAVFLAAVAGDDELVHGLDEALRRPVFAPYLGRRSCPPEGPIRQGVHPGNVRDNLMTHPWLASPWHQREIRSTWVELETVIDAEPGETHTETMRDLPVSFDPRRREYAWREVRRDIRVRVRNPYGTGGGQLDHDPMAALGG